LEDAVDCKERLKEKLGSENQSTSAQILIDQKQMDNV
jgi:hypothetical protein